MEGILKENSLKATFEAEVIAVLKIQSNVLVPIKLAVKLYGISRRRRSIRKVFC